MLLVSMLAILFIFSLIGMEIAWAIGFAAFGYLVLSQFEPFGTPLVLFSQLMIVGLNGYILVAIPLFIFAGELMNKSGVTHRIVALASAIVGHVHGGLANVGVVANFIMSGISGSALADAAATGTVLVPEMNKRGFPPSFSSAVIASAATVGPIVPPSISFVLLGAIAEVSVGRLFMGGVIPGIIMFLTMFVLTYWISKKKNYPVEERATLKDQGNALVNGFLALLAPLFVVGSIVGGIATPTEAAGMGAAGAMLIAWQRKTLTIASFMDVLRDTAATSAKLFMVLFGALIFSNFVNRAGLPDGLINIVNSFDASPMGVVFIILLIYLLLGCVFESLSMILLTVPIFAPVVEGLGFDLIWFGILVVVVTEISLITPPIGLNVFVLKGVLKDVAIKTIFKGVTPFWIADIFRLTLLALVPAISLFLPSMM